MHTWVYTCRCTYAHVQLGNVEAVEYGTNVHCGAVPWLSNTAQWLCNVFAGLVSIYSHHGGPNESNVQLQHWLHNQCSNDADVQHHCIWYRIVDVGGGPDVSNVGLRRRVFLECRISGMQAGAV